MTYFILQTLFWLLLSFLVGLILGRWLKTILCRQSAYVDYGSDEDVDMSSRASFEESADKLALRSRTAHRESGSGGDILAGAAVAGTAGVAAHVSGSSDVDEDVDASTEKSRFDASSDAKSTNRSTDGTDISVAGASDNLSATDNNTDFSATSAVEDSDIAMRKSRQTEIDNLWTEQDDDGSFDTAASEPSTQELMGAAFGGSSESSSHKSGSGIPGIERNNLKIIEGIGPAMEKVLHENGIDNWRALSQTSEADLRAMLDQYGDKYKIIQPGSWIEEARLAAEGNIDELIRVQKVDGVSKLENMLGAGGYSGLVSSDDSAPAAQGLMGSVQDEGLSSTGSSIPGIDADNLQIIEGIGPAMEKVLHENGIDSWRELGRKSEQDLRAMLDKYGGKYKIIQPGSWIEEARLAAEGKVDELIHLQKLDGISKLENMLGASRMSGFAGYVLDDLTIVEGIGPKISELLRNAGIKSWQALASTDTSKIQEILDAAGSNFQMADPSTWAEQADMADREEWAKLKEYQDFLDGGRA